MDGRTERESGLHLDRATEGETQHGSDKRQMTIVTCRQGVGPNIDRIRETRLEQGHEYYRCNGINSPAKATQLSSASIITYRCNAAPARFFIIFYI